MRQRTKRTALLLLLCLSLLLAACGESQQPKAAVPAVAKLAAQSQQEEPEASPTPAPQDLTDAEVAELLAGEPDVDLVGLNANMVYAEVFQIMNDPDEYLGKVIRIQGLFAPSVASTRGAPYFFVFIEDAAACCATGVEFIWDNYSHAWPDEYPAEGALVEVTGVFTPYSEGDWESYYLRTNAITVLAEPDGSWS